MKTNCNMIHKQSNLSWEGARREERGRYCTTIPLTLLQSRRTSNIGHIFLTLIDRHFPRNHILHKIINRNNVKVSYSCMPNMEMIMKRRNKQLLRERQPAAEPTPKPCMCQRPDRDPCPLGGQCRTDSVVYTAKINVENGDEHLYIGVTERPFKKRFNEHACSFRNRPDNHTTLSAKVWDLKDRNLKFSIKWDVLRRGHKYRVGQNTCDLCTSEKLEIIKNSEDPRLLNSRTEVLNKCRHINKFLLSNKNRL